MLVDAFEYAAAFIPLLGILIFVHELGHFLVAKACGVRVLKFSLGFGSPVGFGRHRLRWERNGTEYVIAWFPLGGFVKMLGENLAVQGADDPDVAVEAAPDEYLTAKPTWQKLAIVFAGPAMNLLLPIVAFVAILWVGVPRGAPQIGLVEPGSPAAMAGLVPGDRIVSVDGTPVEWWSDVDREVRGRSGGELRLSVERESGAVNVALPVVPRIGLDEFGVVAPQGWVGIHHGQLSSQVGVESPESPAAAAGLRAGDRISAVGDTEVTTWEALAAAYREAAASGGTVALRGKRGTEDLSAEVPALPDIGALGLTPAPVAVEAVIADSAAAEAGLLAGDLVLRVDGRPVGSFETFTETVRSSGGRELALTIARGGELLPVALAPRERKMKNGLGIEEEIYVIGIRGQPALAGAIAVERLRNPLVAWPRAIGMTVDMTGQFMRGLGKIVTGEVGRDKLAGPIGIAEIARRSLDLGWKAYLYTMILISINLGILNLLPIPILDGGQALIFAIEGVKRAPISMRTRELVQSLGFSVIIMLMGLAFWNDISRNWSRFVEWLTGAGA